MFGTGSANFVAFTIAGLDTTGKNDKKMGIYTVLNIPF